MAAAGLPRLIHQRSLDTFVNVDNDTSQGADSRSSAALLATVVGSEFLTAAEETVRTLEDAFRQVDAFHDGLLPLRDILQEMRALDGAALEASYERGALTLEGFRELLQRFAGHQKRVDELQVRTRMKHCALAEVSAVWVRLGPCL